MSEAVWTTRCIVCDTPGAVLCADCRRRLPYIDRWRACPRCGAPDGILQCTECNSFSLAEIGRNAPPYLQCVNAIEHRGAARAVITGFKDAGERRLAPAIARVLVPCLPRHWLAEHPALTFIPADRRALRRRGFDHMELVAHELSRITGLEAIRLLEKQVSEDQRGLDRRARFRNMSGRIDVLKAEGRATPSSIIVLDDVHTTGATLYAACDTLNAAGASRVRCATFARVI